MLEKCIRNNLILFMQTGSGKTYIAIMLLKHMSSPLRQPYSNGGKRAIFLATTEPLVRQQANVIKLNTNLNVSDYYDTEKRMCSLWSKSEWEKEFEDNEVLVMVPDIFRHVLEHNFIGLSFGLKSLRLKYNLFKSINSKNKRF